jgi:hypothetical protein
MSIMRASTLIDGTTNFFGPTAGGGVELSLGSLLVTAEADGALLTGGPTGVQVLVKAGFGSR